MSREVLNELLELREVNNRLAGKEVDIVFCTREGNYITPSNMSSSWRSLLKLIVGEVPNGIRFHDLRHTHATLSFVWYK